jgi:DNA (cytosine-5)-methyltransferase 1
MRLQVERAIVSTTIAAPPYELASMSDIRAVPDNGYRVVSTFSGCGGSCLGFEAEGYRIAFASEFVPAAADTYEANHPDVPVDRADIRQLSAEHVLDVIGLDAGALDVMEGSPPCASFSRSGIQSRQWGKNAAYSSTHQRTDDLFFEFARLRDGIAPKVFVAENVAGLIQGVSKGYFLDILNRLREGYRVEARLLDAQWLGVPQVRRRLIFVGVRIDLELTPAFPDPLPYRYALGDVIDDIRPQSERREIDDETGELLTLDPYAIGPEYDSMRMGETSNWRLNLSRAAIGRPCPTLLASAARGVPTVVHPTEKRHFTLSELRRLASFPADFELTGSYSQRAERIGRAVPPRMMQAIAHSIRVEILDRL